MYDIIGDIHGRADQLEALLRKMSYSYSRGSFRHPWRKAIFLGDYINKGTQSRKALHIVRSMVETENATALIGNHELNLIGIFHQHKGGDFIRPRTESNLQQHQPTFNSFGGDTAELQNYVQWMKSLPIFIEADGFRAAHAFWHQPSILFLKKNFPQNCPDDALLREMTPGSKLSQAVQEIVVGLKLPLPEESGGTSFKAKWWNVGKTRAYDELAIRPDPNLGNSAIATECIFKEAYQYPEEDKPFFFGHYNLPGKPILLAHNYTCLDYNTDEHPLVVAYRWDGEQMLDSRKIVWC